MVVKSTLYSCEPTMMEHSGSLVAIFSRSSADTP